MQLVLVGLGLLLVILVLAPVLTRPNPAVMARRLKVAAGFLLLGFAGLLLLRGQVSAAVALGGLGAAILSGGPGGLFSGARKSAGQASRIETSLLRASLDHDSGAMTGEIIAGPFAGRTLASLGRDDLLSLLAGCRGDDAQSAAVLEAFLDNRFPDWRDGPEAGSRTSSDQTAGGAMTEEEARMILDVAPNATADDIRMAWREMMKRNHPDQGGSSYLAAKINQARDVLLERQAADR